MEKRWVEYMADFEFFSYTFKLSFNRNNWAELQFEFNKFFMSIGKKYELLYYKNELEFTLENFTRFSKSKGIISPLLFKQMMVEAHEDEDYYIKVPVLTNKQINLDEICYRRPFLYFSLIMFSEYGLFLDDVLKGNEDDEFSFELRISSQSNIWLEQIHITLDEDKVITLDPLANNKPWAYAITPRFNSFLRDLKNKVIELGGIAYLDEGSYKEKYVTENGILLDGKIIYIEDKITYKVGENET